MKYRSFGTSMKSRETAYRHISTRLTPDDWHPRKGWRMGGKKRSTKDRKARRRRHP